MKTIFFCHLKKPQPMSIIWKEQYATFARHFKGYKAFSLPFYVWFQSMRRNRAPGIIPSTDKDVKPDHRPWVMGSRSYSRFTADRMSSQVSWFLSWNCVTVRRIKLSCQNLKSKFPFYSQIKGENYLSVDKTSFSYLVFSLLALLKEDEEEILRP